MSTNPLNAFLTAASDAPPPTHGQRPTEIVRIPFATFELLGTRLGFGDTWQTSEEVAVYCEPGTYQLEAVCYGYGSDRRVAAVRATRTAGTVTRGPLRGEFDVDVGSACLYDSDVIDGYTDHASAEFDRWVQEAIIDAALPLSGTVTCAAARTSLVHFDCGFGDGSYPVFELRDGEEVVGAEAVFIAEDQPYPFGG